MMYLVNKTSADEVTPIDPDNEDAFHIYLNGQKITKFGPTVFAFNTPAVAIKFAERILNEQLVGYEKCVERIKEKKTKLEKSKVKE